MKFWESLGYPNISSTEEWFCQTESAIGTEAWTIDFDLVSFDGEVSCFHLDWEASCESVGEKVKEMASKAKSNIVLYTKKLINFLFGWLIRFFRGSTNVRETMKKRYENAQKYMKTMNEMESRVREYGGDKKVEIANYGNRVMGALTIIQSVKWVLQIFVQNLKNIPNDAANGFATLATVCYVIGASVDVLRKVLDVSLDNSVEALAAVDFKVEAMISKCIEGSEELKKMNSIFQKDGNIYEFMVQKIGNRNPEDGEQKDSDESKWLQSLMDYVEQAKRHIGDINSAAKKYEQNGNKQEIPVTKAFDRCRQTLKTFLTMSKNHDWDFEKSAAEAQKIHQKIQSIQNKMDFKTMGETDSKNLLSVVIMTGNLLGKIQQVSDLCIKGIQKDMDALFTDITKVGSITYKLTAS